MEYLQAFKHDTLCEAYIKCTYVELYSAEGVKLFSLNAPAYSKEKPIGLAKFANVKSVRDLVPIHLAQNVTGILAEYKNIIKTSKGAKFPVADLAKGVVYVKQRACDWKPVNATSVITKDDDGNIKEEVVTKSGLPAKAKIALAAAAALAILGN